MKREIILLIPCRQYEGNQRIDSLKKKKKVKCTKSPLSVVQQRTSTPVLPALVIQQITQALCTSIYSSVKWRCKGKLRYIVIVKIKEDNLKPVGKYLECGNYSINTSYYYYSIYSNHDARHLIFIYPFTQFFQYLRFLNKHELRTQPRIFVTAKNFFLDRRSI